MVKKSLVSAVIAGAFLAAAQIVQAPTQKLSLPSQIERTVIAEQFFEKYNKDAKLKFFHLLYSNFPYADEIPKIVEHSQIFNLEPELLMAIRLAENGEDSVAYGILPDADVLEQYQKDNGYLKDGEFYLYENEKEKQLHWAAQAVNYYSYWFTKQNKSKDFISYLAKRYAPIGVGNDPDGLNRNWERNVKAYYRGFKKR